MSKVGALLLILIASTNAFAESDIASPDLTGVIGEYGAETGSRGAVTNRRVADQLYKQALIDEENGRRQLSIRLLAKAWSETKDAKNADDQAKEFAKAALHGMNSGSQSGPFDAASHGMVSESELRNLATTNSPYMPEVESRLSRYKKMSLSEDKSKLVTPFGSFSANISDGTLETIGRGIAMVLGYNADDVSAGIKDSHNFRAQVAAQVSAQVDQELAERKKEMQAATAANGGSPAEDAAKNGAIGDPARDPSSQQRQVADTNGQAQQNSPFAQEPDWDAKQRAFLEAQNEIRKQLGMTVQTVNTDPLGKPGQDIFEMVHTKYQAIRTTGVFIETEIP